MKARARCPRCGNEKALKHSPLKWRCACGVKVLSTSHRKMGRGEDSGSMEIWNIVTEEKP